jgi:hypothetical protein
MPLNRPWCFALVFGAGIGCGGGSSSPRDDGLEAVVDGGAGQSDGASAVTPSREAGAGPKADARADTGSSDDAHADSAPADSSAARDPLVQPFASTSIWNMPIGSGASYVAANLTAAPPGGTDSYFQSDNERIALTPTAPLTVVYYSSAGWSSTSRCSPSGGSGEGLPATDPLKVPIPSSWIVPSDGGNDGAAILLADGVTVVQMQPFARCVASGSATALLAPPEWTVSLDGDGIAGAHGGSGLSTLGGTIRIGELRPGQLGMKHALKIELTSTVELYHPSSSSDAYRWPALTADSSWSSYGTVSGPNNDNAAMKMGVLLAIPPTTSIASLGLETEPGKQLAWTLQNYGAYDVDSTGGSGCNMATESGVSGDFPTQFQSDYGFAFTATPSDDSPWWRDIGRLRQALSVINNNTASSIGGGGTPSQPLAPPI